MKSNYLLSFFFTSCCIVLLAGCGSNESTQANSKLDLLGTWELADIENYEMNKINTISSKEAKKMVNDIADVEKGAMLRTGLLLSFFSDSTYTEVTGNGQVMGDETDVNIFSDPNTVGTKGNRFIHGRWQVNNSNHTLTLTQQGASTSESQEVLSQEEEYITLHMVKERYKCDFKFRRTGKPLENMSSDPFHISNNQWRILPAEPETDEQLLGRMRNHVQHYIDLLEASLARNQESVTLQYSPSMIQIYNGGIGIRNKQHWDKEFVQCFYSPEEAQQGVDIISKILKKNLSLGASAGNWVKDDANVLRVILTELQ